MKKNILNLNYFAVVLIIVKSMLHYSTLIILPDTIESLIELLAYFIWGITLLTSRYKKKYILTLFVCGGICLYSCYICKSFIIFSSFMFFCLCMSRNSDEKEIIKIVYKTILMVLIVHFIFFEIQYLSGNIVKLMDHTGRIRFTLGFSNPNIVSYYTLWCFLGYVYCNQGILEKKKKLILPISLILIVYLFTKSNTLIFMSISSMILFKIKISQKILKIICKYIIITISIVWIIMVNLYARGNSFALKLNDTLNSRLYYSYETEKRYGYTMLGKNINMDVGLNREKSYMSTSLILDVTYANLLYKYGIVYIFILNIISSIIANSKDEKKMKCLIIWSIFALSETVSLNFIICFSPILGAFALKDRGTLDVKKDN
jgi:hypothetical protein